MRPDVLKRLKKLEDAYGKKHQLHLTHQRASLNIHTPNGLRVYSPTSTGIMFHADNSFVRLVMGPYGSGKSTMCCSEIVMRACQMPPWYKGRRKSRWIIVRNTSGELHSTTLQTWLAWYGDLGDIQKRQKPLLTYEHTFRDDKGTVELELIFIALDREDDLRKIKSLEATGVYINEVSEVPQGALSHFKGRINGRYPSRLFCSKPYWSGIIGDTNPCDIDDWIFNDFERQQLDSYKLFKQPPGLLKDQHGNWYQNPRCDNSDNLASDYYVKLATGQTQDFVKVFCLGEYGTSGFGKLVYPEYNDDLHSSLEVKAIQGLPLYLGWDFGLCYSDDTEVLTNNGWKLFKDVDENIDLAATRNPFNGELEYTKINFKVEYDYNGELLEWASSNVNFCVTPEHRVPFSYRDTPEKIHFESAQWLADHHSGHHYVDLCSKWNRKLDNSISYFKMDSHTYCEFMGLYLSEGCVHKNGNSYRITIYQNKRNDKMQEILDKTNIEWAWFGQGWRCTSNELGIYLYSFGKAAEKYVPGEIKEMPSKQIKAFIYSYTAGDGHIRVRENGSIEHTIFTISKKMSDDFIELAQKCGWNSAVRVVKPQISTIIEQGVPRKIENNGGYNITFKKRAKRAELLARNFKKVPYNGKIYCLNVPYHTLYIKRKGKPSWNGNTPACIVVQITPRGQLLVLKEYCATDMGIRTFAQNVVMPNLSRDFPYNPKIMTSVGDPSGAARDNILEEFSCIGELNAIGIKTFAAKSNKIEARIGAVRYFLNTMIDGKPAILISKDNCPILRKGFIRNYAYKRLKVAGDERYKEEPDKNASSHPHDALQYIAMEFAANILIKDKTEYKSEISTHNPVMRIF